MHASRSIFEVLGRHAVHPFPARMSPGIVLDVIPTSKHPLTVFDPMMGSGTVLAVARARGHRAIGIDIDPLAVLISRVWTTTVDLVLISEVASRVLSRAKEIAKSTSHADAYPASADAETRKFIRYWFDDYARIQLAALARAISHVQDAHHKNVLWCAFSRLIIAKSKGASLAMDLAHSRPHKAFEVAPSKPFANFLDAVKLVAKNCVSPDLKRRGPRTRTILGDARETPLKSRSVDVVLTSPPYLNAIDYMRCSKFSLVWMGHNVGDLTETRASSVGAEAKIAEASDDGRVRQIISDLKLTPKLSRRHEGILARYVFDMKASIVETARVLKKNGNAFYVVGENVVRGTYVRNSHIISALAQDCELTLVDRYSRKLPENRRYLPPPNSHGASSLGARM